MRESAHFAGKQILGWRVMQVDIVGVGKNEFYHTQRIAPAWRLAHRKGKRTRSELGEIDGTPINRSSTAISNFDMSYSIWVFLKRR